MREDIRFHADRAMTELDLALRAACIEAARSHFSLSALHLDRMRNLGGNPREAIGLLAS